MADTKIDPSILEVEARLVKAPEGWFPASIRFTSGYHKFLFESLHEAVRDLSPSEVAGFRILHQIEQSLQLSEQAHQSLLKWAINAGFPFERDPRLVKHLRVDLRNGDTLLCFCYPGEINIKPPRPDDFFHFFSNRDDVDGGSIQWKFIKGWTDLDSRSFSGNG